MYEAFEIGPITIWMRLLFLMIAVWLSAEFFFRLASAAGLGLQLIRQRSLWYCCAFIIGGRIAAVIASYQEYVQSPMQVFILWDGAFSFIGGTMGIALVLFLRIPSQRATFLQWLDVLLPASMFGLSIDALGTFFAAESYGKPTNAPWGVVLDAVNVRYAVPIHPVQLYYAASFFVLTFLLLLVRKHAKRAGSETLFGIVAASLLILSFEFLRGDQTIPVFAKVTDFMFLAVLFTSLGVLALLENRLTRRLNIVYASLVALMTIAYILVRPWIDVIEYQLRFSQLLAVLALLATVVYVVVHRKKYPHL